MRFRNFIPVIALFVYSTIVSCKNPDSEYSLNSIDYTLQQYKIIGLEDKFPEMHSSAVGSCRSNMIHQIVVPMTKQEFDEYRKNNNFGDKNAYVHSHGFFRCFDGFRGVTPKDTNLYQKVVGDIEYCTTYSRDGLMYLNINNYDKDEK